MATYQSIQSGTQQNTSDLVITKPVSLAVGDYMLAGILADRDNGVSAGVNTPSGWTLEESITGTGCILYIFSKIADSADVAASNFTFVGTGSTNNISLIGHILRFTDFGLKIGEAPGTGGGAISTYNFSGFTPSPERVTNTYVIFSAISDNSVFTTSTYAIATSNPTWTERADTTISGASRGVSLAVATASRPESTATGNVTITLSGSLASGSSVMGYMIGLTPKVSGSTTVPTGETFIVNHPFIRNGVTQIDGVNPTTDSMNVTQWTNPDKPSSTWTNPAK